VDLVMVAAWRLRAASGDNRQVAYGYGSSPAAGRALRRRALGATVVPTWAANARRRQIMLMKDFGVTAICCTPTYFLHLIDRAPSLAWSEGAAVARRASSRRAVDGLHAQAH